jgi:hypothetical protein
MARTWCSRLPPLSDLEPHLSKVPARFIDLQYCSRNPHARQGRPQFATVGVSPPGCLGHVLHAFRFLDAVEIPEEAARYNHEMT